MQHNSNLLSAGLNFSLSGKKIQHFPPFSFSRLSSATPALRDGDLAYINYPPFFFFFSSTTYRSGEALLSLFLVSGLHRRAPHVAGNDPLLFSGFHIPVPKGRDNSPLFFFFPRPSTISDAFSPLLQLQGIPPFPFRTLTVQLMEDLPLPHSR